MKSDVAQEVESVAEDLDVDVDVQIDEAALVDLDERVPDAALEDYLEDMVDQLTDSPTRPAASKLATDQARVMVWLLDGFDDRLEMLAWMRELAVQSLGRLPDEWFATVAADSTIVSAFLGEPWGTLRQDGIDDLPPEFASEIRRGMVAKDLIPAFRSAHREFRWSAGERVEFLDDESQNDEAPRVDPSDQMYPAMRPSLGQLSERTEWSLATLLEGFGSRDELLLWTQSTVAIVHAEVDEEDIRQAYFNKAVREVMLEDSARARFMRTAWAAEYLLPAFNSAIYEVSERAGEVIAEEGEGDQTPMKW
jgi:hypothetical protein